MTSVVFRSDHDVSDRLHVHHCAGCAKLRAKIDARGTHFADDEFDEIAKTWRPYGKPVSHDREGATFQLSNGETFRVTHDTIYGPRTLNHEWLRGAMEHVATHWRGTCYISGGKMTESGFVPNANPNDEYRLWYRAYAQVYGIQFEDRNDPHNPLSREALARLPSMIDQVRKMHGDAPQARSGVTGVNQRPAVAGLQAGPGG